MSVGVSYRKYITVSHVASSALRLRHLKHCNAANYTKLNRRLTLTFDRVPHAYRSKVLKDPQKPLNKSILTCPICTFFSSFRNRISLKEVMRIFQQACQYSC